MDSILHTGEDFWKFSDSAEHLPNQPIRTAEGRIDFGTNTNKSTWDGKLEMVALGMQRDDPTKDGFAFVPTMRVLCNNTGSNLNLLTEPQNTSEDRTTGDAAFQVVNFSTRFIDVE